MCFTSPPVGKMIKIEYLIIFWSFEFFFNSRRGNFCLRDINLHFSDLGVNFQFTNTLICHFRVSHLFWGCSAGPGTLVFHEDQIRVLIYIPKTEFDIPKTELCRGLVSLWAVCSGGAWDVPPTRWGGFPGLSMHIGNIITRIHTILGDCGGSGGALGAGIPLN